MGLLSEAVRLLQSVVLGAPVKGAPKADINPTCDSVSASYEAAYVREQDYLTDNERVGALFEDEVQRALFSLVERCNGSLYCNIVIPQANGKNTECDMVLLTPRHIFVIECKNWGGVIFANEDVRPTWTQYKSKGNTNQFRSPIQQNAHHITRLSSYLGVPEACFSSIIIFSEYAKLKRLPVLPEQVSVGNLQEAMSFIAFRLEGTRQDCSLHFELLKPLLGKLQIKSEYDGVKHRERLKGGHQ